MHVVKTWWQQLLARLDALDAERWRDRRQAHGYVAFANGWTAHADQCRGEIQCAS